MLPDGMRKASTRNARTKRKTNSITAIDFATSRTESGLRAEVPDFLRSPRAAATVLRGLAGAALLRFLATNWVGMGGGGERTRRESSHARVSGQGRAAGVRSPTDGAASWFRGPTRHEGRARDCGRAPRGHCGGRDSAQVLVDEL